MSNLQGAEYPDEETDRTNNPNSSDVALGLYQIKLLYSQSSKSLLKIDTGPSIIPSGSTYIIYHDICTLNDSRSKRPCRLWTIFWPTPGGWGNIRWTLLLNLIEKGCDPSWVKLRKVVITSGAWNNLGRNNVHGTTTSYTMDYSWAQDLRSRCDWLLRLLHHFPTEGAQFSSLVCIGGVSEDDLIKWQGLQN